MWSGDCVLRFSNPRRRKRPAIQKASSTPAEIVQRGFFDGLCGKCIVMRILVHEFVSGGGLAGRPVPRALGREGAAMLAALVTDLTATSAHQIVTTRDPRFALDVPSGVDVVTLPRSADRPYPRNLDPLIATADAVWLIAPETDRWLERLAARVE